MKMISLIPLVVSMVCIVFIGAKTKRIPFASVCAYGLIMGVGFIFNSFLLHHWAINLFLWCPIAFVLAWKAVLMDNKASQ